MHGTLLHSIVLLSQKKEGGAGGIDRVEVFQSAKRYTPVVQEHGVRFTSWSYMGVVGIYLPPEVARGAYFHRRHIFLAIRYFSELTYLWIWR